MKGGTTSLTEGNPAALIFSFAVPVFFGRLFQILYSLIDTKIVGMFLGENALAAVGSVSILYNLINGFLSGMTLGFAIVIAQNFGSGDEQKVRKNMAASWVLSYAAQVVIVGGVMLFLKPILSAMHVPEKEFSMAYSYIGILMVGMFATLAYNICADMLRAIGDSVTPLIFLILASVLNVILDILFVAGFHFGVGGAAAATVLAQMISAMLCLLRIRKRFPILWVSGTMLFHTIKFPDKNQIAVLMRNALAMGLMSSLVNLGTLLLQSSVNMLGTTVIVAHTAARKIFEIFLLPVVVLGSSMATYCGQNYGAGKYRRIRQGLAVALGACAVVCVLVAVVTFTVSPRLVSFIASTDDADILYWGSMYLKCNMSFLCICVLIIILRNSMQGFGEQLTPVFSSSIELVGKIIFSLVLVRKFGYWGVIWTEPVVWAAMVVPLIVKTLRHPIMRDKGRNE